MEKSYVSDLLRTQVGVLGGRPQGYIRCPGRCSFGQWARGFMQDSGGQPSRVISFAVGGERVQLSANAPSRNRGRREVRAGRTNVGFCFKTKSPETACSPRFCFTQAEGHFGCLRCFVRTCKTCFAFFWWGLFHGLFPFY